MPHGQQPRDRKISKTVNAIKNCGWRTTNEFVEGFYDSREAVQSLRYQPGSVYAPEHILTSWMSNVPSGNAKEKLYLTITQKAAEIMIQESTKAYHDNGLRLVASSSGFNAELANSKFGLEKIKKTYDTLLPCLSLLLSMLLTAENDYEHKKGAENIGKHDMATKVRFRAHSFYMDYSKFSRLLLS